jgi:hypothetical protein
VKMTVIKGVLTGSSHTNNGTSDGDFYYFRFRAKLPWF